MVPLYDRPDLFRTPNLGREEEAVIRLIDDLRRSLRHAIRATRRWTGLLRRTSLARAIKGSNSIEGYNVSIEDAVAASEGEEPLDAEFRDWREIIGYRNAMTYVLQLAEDPYFRCDTSLIRSLHFMMLQHDLTKHPGRWRPGSIFVHNEILNKQVYEGPDAEKVPLLADEFARWLTHRDDAPAMVAAGMAHLNLVMIHPFSDGNGRMARCLQTLVLAREGILEPQFCSIEEWLGKNTTEYYDILTQVGAGAWHPENDARPWIRFILKAHYQQAITHLRRVRDSEKVWNLLEIEMRPHGLPERAILAMYDATMGFKVRNATYRSAAEVSDELAGRDLKALASLGYLVAHGERRHRYYTGSDILRALRERGREPKREPEDPFKVAEETLPLPFRARSARR